MGQILMVEPRTFVTFNTSLFNTTEEKENFINPCCFGEDAANWIMENIPTDGLMLDEEPDQEDWGWYFDLRLGETTYQICIGFRPEDEEGQGDWLVFIVRDCGFIRSLFGKEKKECAKEVPLAIHKALSSSTEIKNIRWHYKKDFDACNEEKGESHP
jgi:hypothetical protein